MGSELDDADDDVVFVDLDADEDPVFVDLDADEDPAGGAADGEEQVGGRARNERLLPPRASRGRVLASLVSLGLVLGGIGAAGTAAYRVHENDVRVANTIKLAASADAPSIPGLTGLAFDTVWHARPSQRVTIPVVNEGPDTVTLLDATLTEVGLRGTATLEPVGRATIPPGGTGRLAGLVTADCVSTLANQPSVSETTDSQAYAGILPKPGTVIATVTATEPAQAMKPDQLRRRLGTLEVTARSAGGRVGKQSIYPENGLTDTAERICLQEGQMVLRTYGLRTMTDAHKHTITVSVTATSLADVNLQYLARAEFSDQPQAPGLVMPDQPTPTMPDWGTVEPGGDFTVSFQVQIEQCPSSDAMAGTTAGSGADAGVDATAAADVDVDVIETLTFNGEVMTTEWDYQPVQPLIDEACGLSPAG